MNTVFTLTISLALLTIAVNQSVAQGCEGGTATLTVHQTWSQEPQGYNRTALVRAPEACSSGKKFPVVFDLHGIGRQGDLSYLGDHFKDTVVLVAPNAYKNTWIPITHYARMKIPSWNVWNGSLNRSVASSSLFDMEFPLNATDLWKELLSGFYGIANRYIVDVLEASKANDIDFLVALIAKVGKTYPQANMDDVTIVGHSNGAAMLLRLLIEVPAPLPFHRVVPMAASLDEHMYHHGRFRTTADKPIVPATDPPLKYISFHGTNDTIVPYEGCGGFGSNTLWSAQEATHIWANHWGETGAMKKDCQGEVMEDGMVKYFYLGGQVVHYKLPGEGHTLKQYGLRVIVEEVLTNPPSHTTKPVPILPVGTANPANIRTIPQCSSTPNEGICSLIQPLLHICNKG